MIEFVPFRVDHLDRIDVQPAQAHSLPLLRRADLRAWMQESEPAETALVDGVPVACAGIHVHEPGVGRAWGYLSGAIPRGEWVRLTRRVAGALAASPLALIMGTVLDGFVAGHRWCRLLGLAPGGTQEIEGRLYWIYERRLAAGALRGGV